MGVVVPNPTVTEVDGSPSITNVKEIKFSNGTVTADGRTATVVNSGGGASGVTSVSGTSPVSSSGGTTPAISLDDGGISTAKVADLAITNDKIAADAITNAKLADDAVDTANIVTSAVGTNEVAVNAITSSRLNTDAVETDKITDSAVTGAKIADTTITPAKLDKTSGGSPGATTYYRGDGAWATPSGGGSTGVFEVKLIDTALDTDDQDYKSWPLMMMPPYGTGNTITAKTQDKVTFWPFIAPVSGNFNRMYWEVSSAASAVDAKVFLGIYSNGTGNIPTTLAGYATVDTTTAEASSTYVFSSTITLVAGTQYWLASCQNGAGGTYACSFKGCRGSNVPTIAPQSNIKTTYVSQSVTTNSGQTSLAASYDEDDLEPGQNFLEYGCAINIGVEFA